jgi:serine/threonine-protein kinase CLA4
MASYSQSSLQPSRAAPPAPQRRATDNTLSKLGYSSAFPIAPPSPSVSSYHTTYSGIGGSPNTRGDPFDSVGFIRAGWSQVKEDGFFSQWNKRWLVLKEQSLSIQKNEVRKENEICHKYSHLNAIKRTLR